MKNILFAFFTTLVFISCGEKQNTASEEGLDQFNKDSFALAVKEMSSDEFLGRKPFTQGETKTLEYIQTKFAGLGLEPGNAGSWFQDVPMVNIRATADSTMKDWM